MNPYFDSLSTLAAHGLEPTLEESVATARQLALQLGCKPLELLKFMGRCTETRARFSRNGPKPPVPLHIHLATPDGRTFTGGDAIAQFLDEHARGSIAGN